MVRISIGKIPISKGEYVEGMTCQKLWQVTDRGSTFQSRVDNNTTRPTALDADGRVIKVHTDLWLCVADATEAVNATEDMAKVKREWADEKADIDAKQAALAEQSAKAVSDNEDATAKAKKATDDINAAIQAGATSGSAVGVAEAVTYDNSKSGLEGQNLQKAVDEAYRKSNVSDEEGNIVPNSSIHKIEDNPEFIQTLTDSVGKLIEAIGLDGVRRFFAGINVQGTLQCVTDNPEYIAVWLDSQNRIIFGFKVDGDIYIGYGVPSQVKKYISTINADIQTELNSIKQDLADTNEDIDKKINFGYNTYPSNVNEVSDNPEYISIIKDAIGHILEAYGMDGIKRFFTAVNVMGTLFNTIENPEFIFVETDKLGRLLGGWKEDGDYIFGAGVPTQIQLKTRDIIEETSTANAVEIDTDEDENVYAFTGINGNINVNADDEGNVFLIYDTDRVNIEDCYEDEKGNLIVEQNKVVTL